MLTAGTVRHSAMIGPVRRRRRPAVSCSLCRRRKIKCDRQAPCRNCVRSKNEALCEYDTSEVPQHLPPTFRAAVAHAIPTDNDLSRPSHTASSVSSPHSTVHATVSTKASTITSPHSDQNVEALKDRVRQLEQRLAETAAKSAGEPPLAPIGEVVTAGSTLTGLFHLHNETIFPGQSRAITRSLMHKSRLFGQSHWMNGMATEFWNLFQVLETHARNVNSQAFSKLQKCKAIGKLIKDRRTPSWPVVTAIPLPRKEVADELVDCYLRSSEAIYRILHIPTFRRDYDALWVGHTTPDSAFLIQLKLVLAIGAATYDERFTLRPSAIAWVYEALTLLAKPEYKLHLSMQFLQLNLLVLLAREATGIGATLTWIPAGSVLRMAMHIGLHRDPDHLPKRTLFAAEMRRRLWNTVLELSLSSSMTSGGPPLLSLEDFDTRPPSNFDDDQLTNVTDADPPTPKADHAFTQTSIAIALRKTFPARLAITRALNNLDSKGTYDETLRLDAGLRTAYKQLCHSLHQFSANSPSTETTENSQHPSPFSLHLLDFLINRHLIALHMPYFNPALHDPATYAYTRKVLTETSVRIWCTAYPTSAIIQHPLTRLPLPCTPSSASPPPHAPTPPDSLLLLSRYITNFAGPLTQTTVQVCSLAALELRAQVQESLTTTPFTPDGNRASFPIRTDLLTITREAKSWLLRCLASGETNMKGYLLQCLVEAQVEAVLRRVPAGELGAVLVAAAEGAVEVALGVLAGVLGDGNGGGDVADAAAEAAATAAAGGDGDASSGTAGAGAGDRIDGGNFSAGQPGMSGSTGGGPLAESMGDWDLDLLTSDALFGMEDPVGGGAGWLGDEGAWQGSFLW
ncbi:Zn(II)2Cys6 transcription factor [Aspergillus saccharolyticus JOP 1030-1]|uniref:Zn(2)-C6 fungal-type domain-containing protein n=1 Tax=Aspergillus saccharolyticus JOP 1030-1 TaxID=1450539 RepID=A0A318ZGW4_9EURO|nr:hypothetical protein BP01DRAFT_32952 [Aspergillus saccharolyticus JOP 1030-1]PYH45997.1 hypothetical protein BP01DRAFT_32952 [Aspergillus saccharolyticus JOP 1030-1]